MELMSQRTKMRMNRLRLINWHYLSNETIEFKGSNLFSGENGAGKSTVLDAIQMILTTNTHRFNQAANSDSKRSLKTYVRGKTGEEGNEYLRKGAVISYVAIEMYEESKDRFFVLGLKTDSPDLESDVRRKWFCEEGSFEQLSFIVNNKPAMDNEFKNNGRKITFIHTDKEAKNRFRHRLGHLQDSFFELLPKSIAFKPMKDVKSFVSQFILPEKEVDIEALRENINNLKEMQGIVEQIKRQVSQLEDIQNTYSDIRNIDRQILVIDLLIKIAEYGTNRDNAEKLKNKIAADTQRLVQLRSESGSLDNEYNALNEKYADLLSALKSGENAILINRIKSDIGSAEKDRYAAKQAADKLDEQLRRLKAARKGIPSLIQISDQSLGILEGHDADAEVRNRIVVDIKSCFEKAKTDIDSERITCTAVQQKLTAELNRLSEEIKGLEQNKITYNPNVVKLKGLIEQELANRGINAPVYVLADLLEISEENKNWQNAVEGYLNTQRFYLIVEPQYYDIAASVYDRNKAHVHTAAVVNTARLDTNTSAEENSLASVIVTENRYAKAFVCYVLNKVRMCSSADELKQYETSVTSGCMLYQGKALRKINPDIYRMPYIGKYALQKQLEIKKKEYAEKKTEKEKAESRIKAANSALDLIGYCNFETLADVITSPLELKRINEKLSKLNNDLKEAENDPTYLQLQEKAALLKKEVDQAKSRRDGIIIEITEITSSINTDTSTMIEHETAANHNEQDIKEMSEGNDAALSEARKKYDDHKRTKSSDTIYTNYQPRKAALQNSRNDKVNALNVKQSKYKDGDLGTGLSVMGIYSEEYNTLTRHDLIAYEEKLTAIRNNCEIEFRESFLVKMRENIEKARELFKDLNKTLKPIYYGNDSYQFSYPPDSSKRKLYEMIMSNFNLGEFNLFSTQFDKEYHDEMEELFSKLTASDEKGEDVIREYTDYRSYMDYDIDIVTRDGRSQKFSKIYREKSGGETQTPYYVAIAASFAQIYNTGETVRVIMLDEAFDKMDEERIRSMMDFFKSQDFQIILAAPSTRLELIGEQTDNIVMVYSDADHYSYTEAFSYDEL